MQNVQTAAHPGAPPKRRLRNFLLDSRFQLKYTSMVVGITLVLSMILGFWLYKKSRETSDVILAQSLMDPAYADPAMRDTLEEAFAQTDRTVLMVLVTSLGALVFALGLAGIVITHKVVGPVYKMKRQLEEVARGHLKIEGKLRKGDELQDFFNVFSHMVQALRDRQSEEIAELDQAIDAAKAAGASDDGLAKLRVLRERMQKALE
jgi:nitrogen fixation/metabolism regulation signal transduction histidine kinase